jgi:hypothetical protein
MYKFAEERQNDKKEKLSVCLEKSSDMKGGKDVVAKFLSCYEDLIKDYSELEGIIANEFSNII